MVLYTRGNGALCRLRSSGSNVLRLSKSI